MPTPPPLPDAETISAETAAPLPPQIPEPLAPGSETQTLEQSARTSVTKEMATTNFYKELDALIAKQRNPKVADLTIQEAIITAIRRNPEILAAVQELNTTSGRFISVRSRIIPQVTLKSDYGYTSRELQTVQDLGAPNVNDEQWGVNVEFSQLIYDGGAVVSGMRAAISDEVESYYRLRGVIDRIIKEPMGGAQRGRKETIEAVGKGIEAMLKELSGKKPDALIKDRRAKFIDMGSKGLAA
jgi:hypothetical protein